jgi:hypothetical protein
MLVTPILTISGRLLDLFTTFIGLNSGFTEANPVSLTPYAAVLSLVLAPFCFGWAEYKAASYPRWVRFFLISTAFSAAWFPTLHNIVVLILGHG